MKPKQPEIDPDPETDDETAAAAPAPAEDIILHEAQNILVDYSNLLKGQPVVSQR